MTDEPKGAYDDTMRTPTPQVRVTLPEIPIEKPGTQTSPRYRDQGVLGKGGMGDVRLVAAGLIGREVAVKSVAAKHATTPGMRERFLREVRIQGQLEHPAVVPVYDAGVDPQGNEFFM